MAQNHAKPRGIAAPGSRPAGSRAYPQGGRADSLMTGPNPQATAALTKFPGKSVQSAGPRDGK